MAKTNTISIFEATDTQAKLNEIQVGIIENLQKTGNSFRFKSQNANLSEKAGSYIFKRFKNSTAKTYGTARTALAGDQLTAPDITVNVDTHKEIVEEVAKFDAERFGVDKSVLSIVNKRKTNHEMTLKADIERAFWKEAYIKALAGDDLALTGKIVAGIDNTSTTTVDKQIEDNAITQLEVVENDYVMGVPRTLMGGVMRPGAYSNLKSALNQMYNANFAIADEDLKGINGVALFSELYLPKKVDYIIMAKESVAQPLTIDEYQGERIPLSNDVAVEMFYDYGTKALSADLIAVGIQLDATHTKVETIESLPAYAAASADTVYVASKAITIGSGEEAVVYKIGDMFTCTKTAPDVVAWTQYNV